jgi:TRAP-type C4-dicarboxylate transport system permease large subunit
MLLLVGILVIIGMVMDPYGAVILVSVTISNVAYKNGIDPIHFWMVTLVAFELGYLSPPVALNHLLTRQVVGEAEVKLALQEGNTFYQRHERILMPLIVMGTALIIVAFGPLVFDYY